MYALMAVVTHSPKSPGLWYEQAACGTAICHLPIDANSPAVCPPENVKHWAARSASFTLCSTRHMPHPRSAPHCAVQHQAHASPAVCTT